MGAVESPKLKTMRHQSTLTWPQNTESPISKDFDDGNFLSNDAIDASGPSLEGTACIHPCVMSQYIQDHIMAVNCRSINYVMY